MLPYQVSQKKKKNKSKELKGKNQYRIIYIKLSLQVLHYNYNHMQWCIYLLPVNFFLLEFTHACPLALCLIH